jgi:hypothetical protein
MGMVYRRIPPSGTKGEALALARGLSKHGGHYIERAGGGYEVLVPAGRRPEEKLAAVQAADTSVQWELCRVVPWHLEPVPPPSQPEPRTPSFLE